MDKKTKQNLKAKIIVATIIIILIGVLMATGLFGRFLSLLS